MQEVVIVGAARTPIGSFNGALASMNAVQLGTTTVKAACARTGIAPEEVQEVIMGQILQAGLGQNPARQVAIHAGIPVTVPSYTVNKLCGSGLKAVSLAAQSIRLGDTECVVAGGMESMTNAPYLLDKARWGLRMGDGVLVDTLLCDGLSDIFNKYHMGITAENLAEKFGISREEQDAFALASQKKAVAAIDAGAFQEEICPVTIMGKKGDVIVDTDEFPRRDANAENLAKLRPAFKKDGTVTAGNASGINDGAAVLVLTSAAYAAKKGLKPLARIVSYASGGVDPSIMGLGPVPATQLALQKAGWNIKDLDFIEGNEAFAAQSLSVAKELNFPMEKVNIRGGAIALGHPIGASGARILVTLLHILKQCDGKRGLATLCIGGGQGVAVLVERV